MLVVVRVLFSASILHAFGSLLEIDGLLFVLSLSVLLIAPSMASAYDQSLQYALLISGCLILARLYTAVVPIREVLEAFFWSGIVSVALFLPLSFATLMQSIQTLDESAGFFVDWISLRGGLEVSHWRMAHEDPDRSGQSVLRRDDFLYFLARSACGGLYWVLFRSRDGFHAGG
jgi:hypothetical protein